MNGLPTCLQQQSHGDHAELQLRIAADLPWFAGHFEHHAILPGVVQIGWAVHYAQQVFGFGPKLASMEQIKFKRPIGPGLELSLHLNRKHQGKGVRYEYRSADTSYSSGSLTFI